MRRSRTSWRGFCNGRYLDLLFATGTSNNSASVFIISTNTSVAMRALDFDHDGSFFLRSSGRICTVLGERSTVGPNHSRCCLYRSVTRSQILIVLSLPPVTKLFPSARKAMQRAFPECALNEPRSPPPLVSQSVIVPPTSAVARISPSLEKANAVVLFVSLCEESPIPRFRSVLDVDESELGCQPLQRKLYWQPADGSQSAIE